MKRKQRQKRLQQEVVFPVRKEIKGTRGQQVRLGRGAFRDRKVIPAPRDQRGILALLGQRVRKEPPAQPGHRDLKGIREPQARQDRRDLKGIRELQARQAHRDQKVTKAIRGWLDQQVRQVRRGRKAIKVIRE
ncbi:hypothetical protein OkiPb00119_09720 [Escherichia coli]|nr:hypothetical protein JE86ST05C_12890 [Escherichia coli]